MAYRISALYSYPVKSMAAISMQKGLVDEFGFLNDRRFMLVDGNGKFVSQRTVPKMGLIKAIVENGGLVLSHSEFGSISLDFDEFVTETEVTVWGDAVSALAAPVDRVSDIVSYLDQAVSLVYMPDSSFRQVDKAFFNQRQGVGFADGFPFLLANEASLSDLNAKLDSPIGMSRFRPNIVVEGDKAFEEDGWKRIKIGEIEFAVVKPCSRCVMTTINEKGEKTSKEPLKTLGTYRKNEYGICFGQNLVQLSTGTIQVGDEFRILE